MKEDSNRSRRPFLFWSAHPAAMRNRFPIPSKIFRCETAKHRRLAVGPTSRSVVEIKSSVHFRGHPARSNLGNLAGPIKAYSQEFHSFVLQLHFRRTDTATELM